VLKDGNGFGPNPTISAVLQFGASHPQRDDDCQAPSSCGSGDVTTAWGDSGLADREKLAMTPPTNAVSLFISTPSSELKNLYEAKAQLLRELRNCGLEIAAMARLARSGSWLAPLGRGYRHIRGARGLAVGTISTGCWAVATLRGPHKKAHAEWRQTSMR
jgi:hypothetical protein